MPSTYTGGRLHPNHEPEPTTNEAIAFVIIYRLLLFILVTLLADIAD